MPGEKRAIEGRREASKDVGRGMISRLRRHFDKYETLSAGPAALSPAEGRRAVRAPQTLVRLSTTVSYLALEYAVTLKNHEQEKRKPLTFLFLLRFSFSFLFLLTF
jgi:hypothetical protein